MKKIYLLLIVTLSLTVPVYAHPGRTDGRGGHVCKTNCSKWGVRAGAWHPHGSPKVKAAKAKAKPKAKVKAKKVTRKKSR